MKLPDLNHIQCLYDESRFLDAYSATEDLWGRVEVAEELSVEGLVLAARLAVRLGSRNLSRWLYRRTQARAPDSPLVRFYARGADKTRYVLYDILRDYEDNPTLDSGVPELDAAWLGEQAVHWSYARFFEKAHGLLRRAREFEVEHAYLSGCSAMVLMSEDRLEEALEDAQRAWTLSPGTSFGAHALSNSLARLGRSEELSERLLTVTPKDQSYEVLDMVLASLLATAERAKRETRATRAREAYEMAGRVMTLAPLADRALRSLVAWRKLDAAFLMGERDLISQHAEEVHSPFYETVGENLLKDPEGKETVLKYKPVRQMHDTCLPASVVAVLAGFDMDVDQNKLAEELTWGGTSPWRAQEWAERRGIAVRHFTATPALAEALIENGIPFVFSYQAPASAHAMAAVGIDLATRTLIVHDPSTDRLARILLDRMSEDEEPFGPRAMAFMPTERASELDRIPRENSEPAAAFAAHHRATEIEGPSAATSVAERVMGQHPDAPVARHISAIDDMVRGNVSRAFDKLKVLVERHPNSINVRASLLSTLERFRNPALATRILADVVERGLVPGIREGQPWSHPPANYLSRYADHLRMSAVHRKKAHRLIRTALVREPFDALTFHVLGDAFWQEGRFPESVLPYLVSAHIEPTNEHFAWAASNAMRKTGRQEDGLAFLASRAAESRGQALGAPALVTWLDALTEYGRPEEAVGIMEAAEKEQPESAQLAAFGVRFWSGLGRWNRARDALDRVEASGQRLLFLEAATRFCERQGLNKEGIRHCRGWLRESRGEIEPRNLLLTLVARHAGELKSLAVAETWCEEHPDDEGLVDLLLEQLASLHRHEPREALLRSRLERTPEDSSAWTDLGHKLVDRLILLTTDKRGAMLEELEHVLHQCERTAPNSESTLVLKCRLLQNTGRRAEALELALRALELAPESQAIYGLLWECSASLDRETQERIWQQAEERLFFGTGHLHAADRLSRLIADRFGVKEAVKSVDGWLMRVPRDPHVIEAKADLLLFHAGGRKDAEQAIGFLEEAVLRFPHQAGLRLSLAHAWGILDEEEKAITTLRDLLRREPMYSAARQVLARWLARADRVDEALTLTREGTKLDRSDSELWVLQSEILKDRGKLGDSARVLEEAIARSPASIPIRENLIRRLLEAGESVEAIRVAREGVGIYPDGAYVWWLLANTLSESRDRVAFTEIEEAYRKSLSLNAGLYAAADGLAMLLAEQRKFEVARTVVKEILPLLDDPSFAEGRLAWISRSADEPNASRELLGVLRKHPHYEWGWRHLLSWIEDDEDWDLAREALGDLSVGVGEFPSLAARRLSILAKTGVPPEELDGEWRALLADQPADESLHLLRFDDLWSREMFEEAAEVLDGIEQLHAASAFILARRIQVLAQQDGPRQVVLDAAIRLWTMQGDDGSWPDLTAWEAIEGLGPEMVERTVLAAAESLEHGDEFRKAAFGRLLENAKFLKKGWKRKNIDEQSTAAEREFLEHTLERLRRVTWDASLARAEVLQRLHDRCGPLAVLRIYDRNPGAFSQETPVWQQVGSVLITRTFKSCQEWQSDWRNRVGVEMWAVANYGMALAGTGAYEELYESSRDALDRLAHDHTTLCHVCHVCLASIHLRRDADLLRHVERYRALLDGPPKEMWLPDGEEAMPRVTLLFARLLASDRPEEVRRLTRQFAPGTRKSAYKALRREWRRRLVGRVSRLQRAMTYLRFLFA